MGTFEELKLKGIIYSGKRLLDYLEDVVKMAYFLPDDDPTKDWYRDFMWYLWCGPKSPGIRKGQYGDLRELLCR